MFLLFRLAASALLVCVLSVPAVAQTAVEGSIRGYVKDEQGAVVRDAVVEAHGPRGTETVRSDDGGAFRILNLPPGEYRLTARVDSFSPYERAGVDLPAGINLTFDIVLRVGSVEEHVAIVDSRAPVDSSRATTAVSISGSFQRATPVALSRHWADFLGMTPGLVTTAQNTTVDSYSLHGSDFASHAIQVDGADMSSVQQNATSFMNLSAEAIDDVQVKTAGVDASAPLGVGAVISLATRSGTDAFHGGAGVTVQRKRWASNNNPGGSSASLDAARPDASLGGPIVRGRAWFFGAYGRDDVRAGVTRTPEQVSVLRVLDPTFEPFDARVRGHYAFGKLTLQHAGQSVEGWYHYDPQVRDSVSAVDTERFSTQTLGGTKNVNVRLASIWSDRLITRVGVSFNDKGQQLDSGTNETSRIVHATSFVNAGRRVGSGAIAAFDNGLSGQSFDQPLQKWTLTTDLTWFTPSAWGAHEVQTGLYVQPRTRQDVRQRFANGGRPREELVLRNPQDPGAGFVPFYREVYDAPEIFQSLSDTRDVAVYVQDAWTPHPRVTINAGVRVDTIRRIDRLVDVVTQDSVDVGPRAGVSYLVAADGRDVVRATWTRVHDVLSTNAVSAGTNVAGKQDLYDLDLDGIFETVLVTPASTRQTADRILDLNRGQPSVDEWSVGYTRRLPGAVRVDLSFVHREYRERTALVEENGIYDGGVFRGYEDERLNEIYRVTSNTWNWPVYRGLELTVSQRTGRLQVLSSLTRSWQRIEGTWQPQDPAAFIQPGAFPNDRGIGSVRTAPTAANDANGLSGTHMTGNGAWRDYVARAAVAYRGPWGLLAASSYTWQSGSDSGPIVTRLSAPDPSFGAPTVTLNNGRVVSNPLATLLRFAHPTRGDGQLRSEALQIWNVRLGRTFRVGAARLEGFADVFNVPNADADQGFMSGANQTYNPNYGRTQGRQLPRSFQLGARLTF